MSPKNGTKAIKAMSGDKREAILRAAIRVFAQSGYFNAKVADIAREAGIADGTVYLYFKSKEEILHSVFDKAMEDFISEGKRELSKIENPIEKLRRVAQIQLKNLESDRDLAIVFQVELRGSTKFMEEFSAAGFAQYLDVIRDCFVEGQQKGLIRKELNPKVCAKIFFGAIDEMITNWILSKKPYPLEPMADIVFDIFFNGAKTNASED